MTDEPDASPEPPVPPSEFAEFTKRIMEQLTPELSRQLDKEFAGAKQRIMSILADSASATADSIRDQLADALRPNVGLLHGQNQVIIGGTAEERSTAHPGKVVETKASFTGSGELTAHVEIATTGMVARAAMHVPEVRFTDGRVPDKVSSQEILRHAGTVADLFAIYHLLAEDDPQTIVLRALLVATLIGLLIALHGKR